MGKMILLGQLLSLQYSIISSPISANVRSLAPSNVYENTGPHEMIEEERVSTDFEDGDESDFKGNDEEFIDHDHYSDDENFIDYKHVDEDFIDHDSDNEDDITIAHKAAANNDIKTLISLRKSNQFSLLFQADSNGWTPLHEAVRSDHTDIVRFLLKNGAY